ncbi:hypothetical protein GCM10029978_068120 [Actinoallomurus acanthiterrae]
MSDGELVIATFNLKDGTALDLLSADIEQASGIDVLFQGRGALYRRRTGGPRYRAEKVLARFGLPSFLTRSRRRQLHDLHQLADAAADPGRLSDGSLLANPRAAVCSPIREPAPETGHRPHTDPGYHPARHVRPRLDGAEYLTRWSPLVSRRCEDL